jgi:hypothetical protein
MNDLPPLKFTCKICGGHGLTVTHVWSILTGTESESWQEWGPLEGDHLWHYDYGERIVKKVDENNGVERGDFGEFAEVDSDSEPEEYEMTEQKSNSEYFVNCANCDREIEFGWSQLDRHGLILPVEFTDFNPLESWPDPKYVDIWQQKGWLRTGHLQP